MKKTISPIMKRSAAPPMPAPIPAFAPVLSPMPVGCGAGVLPPEVVVVDVAVAVVAVVAAVKYDVALARGGAYESIRDRHESTSVSLLTVANAVPVILEMEVILHF